MGTKGQKSDSGEKKKGSGRPAANLGKKDYRPMVRAIWGRRDDKHTLTKLSSDLASTNRTIALTGAVPSAEAIKKMIMGQIPISPAVLDAMHDHFGFRAWGVDRDATWQDTGSINAALDEMADGLHVLLRKLHDATGHRLSLAHDRPEIATEHSSTRDPVLQRAGPNLDGGVALPANRWHLFRLGHKDLAGGSVVVLEFGCKSRKFWSLMDRSDVATLNGNAIDQAMRLPVAGSTEFRVRLWDASDSETCEIFILWFRDGPPEAIVDELPSSCPGKPTAEVDGLRMAGALKQLEGTSNQPLVTSFVYTPY